MLNVFVHFFFASDNTAGKSGAKISQGRENVKARLFERTEMGAIAAVQQLSLCRIIGFAERRYFDGVRNLCVCRSFATALLLTQKTKE